MRRRPRADLEGRNSTRERVAATRSREYPLKHNHRHRAKSGLRFYNPDSGRWLNRDRIGERGGRNLIAFDGNDLINAVDPFGKAISKKFVRLTAFHASVERDDSPFPIINGDLDATEIATLNANNPPGPFNSIPGKGVPRKYVFNGAIIDAKLYVTSGSVIAEMETSTHLKDFIAKPNSLQMSADIGAELVVCGCCPGRKFQVTWELSASITASGATSGAETANAEAAGIVPGVRHKLGNPAPPAKIQTVEYTFDSPASSIMPTYGCKSIRFAVGSGWLDYDKTGAGVHAVSRAVASGIKCSNTAP